MVMIMTAKNISVSDGDGKMMFFAQRAFILPLLFTCNPSVISPRKPPNVIALVTVAR